MEKQVKIIGASREEIEESLGSPETLESDTISFKIDRKEYPADQVMIYYIGSDYMDVLWLVIVMDENGMSENFFTDVSWRIIIYDYRLSWHMARDAFPSP